MANFTQPQAGPQPAYMDVDAKLDEFDSVPLFMRSPPPDDPSGSNTSNVAWEAIRSLAYEGTPDEQAMNYKERGNEYYKGKRYAEAAAFYTQGIDAKPESQSLREALLANRAACNLELKNFGSVLRDTSLALQINPISSKAYYRAALALLSLDRYEEGLDCCDRCLLFDTNNLTVKRVRSDLVRMKTQRDQKEMEKQERLRKEREEMRIMGAAFQALNIFVVPPKPGTRTTYAPHFDPMFSGLRTSATPVMFPVFFLYPQYSQSDYISSFDPSSTFWSHLQTMFPDGSSSSASTPFNSSPTTPTAEDPAGGATSPEWDTKHQYSARNLVVFAVSHRRKLLKIGRRMTLRDACDAAAANNANAPPDQKDGLELNDGSLTFYLVPKGEFEEKWVDETKRRIQAGWF